MECHKTFPVSRTQGIWWISLFVFFITNLVKAQTDDLMIVEYLDSDPGAGFGITIFNPTNNAVDLSNYSVGVYSNGGTTGNEYPLSGILLPGGLIKAGNNSYCGSCDSGCDQVNNSGGVNGNDAVVLFKSPGMTMVDMVGLYGADLTWQVDGTNNALFHHHLYRRGSNCMRYSSTDGVSPNSWPNSPTVNFQGWRVESVSGSEACLRANFSFDNSVRVILPADTSFCEGSSFTIQANPASGFEYLWNTGQTSDSITVSNSGTYILEGIKAGCKTWDSIEVRFNAGPEFSLGPDQVICPGATAILSIQDSAAEGTYEWNTGDTGRSLVADSGIFILSVTDKNNCLGRDTIQISKEELVVFSLIGKSKICLDSNSMLVPQANFVHYLWNTGDTTRNLFVAEAGNYFVTGFSQRECPYLSAEFEVKSIPCNYSIPNLFTPNEDGENDTWRTKEPFLASVNLKVYNRWGKEVYSSENPAFSWDGKNASSGSYFYHLSGLTIEGENFSASGWVTMVK